MINFIKQSLRPLKHRIRVPLNYADDYNYGLNRAEYYEWYIKYSQRLRQFKNIHKGESCFIIGNGPSLNKMDLEPLKNYHTFGLNKIYLIFDKVDLNLSYHVAVNSLVIDQSFKIFQELQCPSFLSYKIFCSSREQINRKKIELKNIYPILTTTLCKFEPDISRAIYEGYTVTFVAMQIAFYMGFKKVFLIGVDHNFKALGKPNEKQILEGDDPNHFSPNYFGNQAWHLPDLEGSELSYRMAKFNYERAGRKIYDATVDGKLNIFPKISYQEALNELNFKKA